MAQILTASVRSTNERMGYTGRAGDNPEIGIDYVPPLGDGKGYLPLELILVSLSACAGSSVALLLRRMHRTVIEMNVSAEGERREEHPTGFSKIRLRFGVKSPDATADEVQRALQMSEEKFCPVWAMLKGGVIVETEVALSL
jgi:putative redox protein